ncbi:hypothetical protein IWW50_001161 [Coemansia erecta]|nr:hypothetical protein GGF43_001026 [Coemansia sp. RSA 2618]KAJ2828873.1 hypothetical protein IWW50_001161 [Coemansia erecta]
MATELRSAGRILATSTAANIVAEVTRDTLRRTNDAHGLYSLGRMVGAHRLTQAGGRPMLDAVLRACTDEALYVERALALAGGILAATDGDRARSVCTNLAQRLESAKTTQAADTSGMLQVWAELAALIRLPNMAEVVAAAERAGDARVLEQLAAHAHRADVERVAGAVHALSVAVLLRFEGGVAAEQIRAEEQAHAVVRAAAAVAQRGLQDEGRDRGLDGTWVLVADALACAHWATLREDRAGTDAFRLASTLLVAFAQRSSDAIVDAMVRRVFGVQPCLRFLAAQTDVRVGVGRESAVLFYLDLLEHVAGQLQPHTVRALVVPLAARYTGSVRERAWFESAHALVLAVLDRPDMAEVAPWYAHMVLDLYPDRGITADLLRIAFTAAVRALAHDATQRSAALSWDTVELLATRLDESAGAGVVRGVQRRELLGVLAAQLAAVPLQLLPRLMFVVEKRVTGEDDWFAQRKLVDEIQDVVLDDADLPRKPALSTWVWQLRARVNESAV